MLKISVFSTSFYHIHCKMFFYIILYFAWTCNYILDWIYITSCLFRFYAPTLIYSFLSSLQLTYKNDNISIVPVHFDNRNTPNHSDIQIIGGTSFWGIVIRCLLSAVQGPRLRAGSNCRWWRWSHPLRLQSSALIFTVTHIHSVFSILPYLCLQEKR